MREVLSRPADRVRGKGVLHVGAGIATWSLEMIDDLLKFGITLPQVGIQTIMGACEVCLRSYVFALNLFYLYVSYDPSQKKTNKQKQGKLIFMKSKQQKMFMI